MQPQINDMERRLGIMQSVEPVLENAIKTLQKVVDVRGMGKASLIQIEDDENEEPVELIVSEFGGGPPHSASRGDASKKHHHHHQEEEEQEAPKPAPKKDDGDIDIETTDMNQGDLDTFISKKMEQDAPKPHKRVVRI